MTSLRILGVAAAIVLALSACKRPDAQDAVSAPGAAATADQPAAAPAAPNQVAPKPQIPTLHATTVDGKPYDLAEHRGNWVVVNFWATWCGPCLEEMPELSALDAMREHIEVIGLAYEDIDVADMQAFLKKHPVVYPVAIIDTMNPPADFATPRGLPMTYLIAPDGKVARQFLGPVTAKDIEAAIASAAGTKAEANAAS